MSEKNMGRKFKVGDKVKLTKAGEEADFFNPNFRKGDTAEIMELNSFDGSISEIMVTSGEAKGYSQLARNSTTWFKHVKTKKKHKKKHKHFRMGDFVKLKDGVDPSEALGFGEMPPDAVGVVCGNGGAVSVEVRYGSGLSDYDRVRPETLRLATKEERKALRKLKVAKITYDNASEIEQDTEVAEEKLEIPSEYDIKVGDIVEVTENAGGYPVGTIGQVDTINNEDIEGYHNDVIVRSTDGDYWNECNVKLLYRPNMKVCSAFNYNIKVGDIVEITEDVLGHSVGKLGEVTELFCPDNPETRNIATVIDFSGETHIERNVKLVYRKPETKSK